MKEQYTRDVLDNLMYTDMGQKIFSFILGLAFALLFNRVCKKNCTQYFAPYTDEFVGKSFRLEDTCYEYIPYMVECKKGQDILLPYDIGIIPDNKIVVKSSLIE